MTELNIKEKELEKIKELVNDGKLDSSVEKIALFLNQAPEGRYIERLEEILEILLKLVAGKHVIRFLLENLIIDLPSLLENLSKRDSVLRYSFLLLLKSICEQECDLFLPFTEDLLESDDPNVKEASLQLIIFMAGGEKKIDQDSLIRSIASKITDEKEFVIEKAVQALIAIGKQSPSIVTKILTDYAKEFPDREELKKNIDNILKAIVTVEKIEEIVEEEKLKEEIEVIKTIEDKIEEVIGKAEDEIIDKEIQIKKEKLELKKKKIELEEKEKDLEQEKIQAKEMKLEVKEESAVRESDAKEELEKVEIEIMDEELELKKKDLELKKKKLELEKKEKELEEKEIQAKEKALKQKEELLRKEKELAEAELELKKKKIEEKEQQLVEEETKRIQKKIVKLKEESEENKTNEEFK